MWIAGGSKILFIRKNFKFVNLLCYKKKKKKKKKKKYFFIYLFILKKESLHDLHIEWFDSIARSAPPTVE
jgi:hypothetical protein